MKTDVCSVDGCSKLVHCKGMCQAHYRNQRKYGNPYGSPNPNKPGPKPDPTKFRSRHNPDNSARRKQSTGSITEIPSHCKRGHVLDETTLRWNTKGARYCGACAAENSQKSRKAADPAYGTRRDKYSPERLAVQDSVCRNGHVVGAEDVKVYANGNRRCQFCVAENMANNRFRKYGITAEEYEQRLALQNGVCGICDSQFRNTRDEHIDHDHVTGQVRGILCSGCNKALGNFKDSPEIILKAAEYIMRSWDKSSA